MQSLTSRQIAALRLQTLGILRPAGAEPRPVVDVVGHLLALQAQDFTSCRWVIGCRTATPEHAVVQAFDSGQIVRSWPMRRTVHATLAEDMPWMLDLAGVRALSPKSLQRSWSGLGTNEATIERAREVAVQLLRGGGRATRKQFAQALADAGIDVAGQMLYYLVWYLCQTKTLVLGPTDGNDHLLVLSDEWIKNPRTPDRETALRELVTRYLRSHAPATIDDMAWWSGLTKSDLRAGIESAGDRLVAARHATTGAELWMTADTLDVHSPDPGVVRNRTFALTPFDEHLLGYARRDDVLDPDLARAVDPARNGVFRPTIVSNGRVIATWRAQRRTRGLHVAVAPFDSLSATQLRGVTRALTRWSAFRGQDLIGVSVAK